jgi:hypothetical protein
MKEEVVLVDYLRGSGDQRREESLRLLNRRRKQKRRRDG